MGMKTYCPSNPATSCLCLPAVPIFSIIPTKELVYARKATEEGIQPPRDYYWGHKIFPLFLNCDGTGEAKPRLL